MIRKQLPPCWMTGEEAMPSLVMGSTPRRFQLPILAVEKCCAGKLSPRIRQALAPGNPSFPIRETRRNTSERSLRIPLWRIPISPFSTGLPPIPEQPTQRVALVDQFTIWKNFTITYRQTGTDSQQEDSRRRATISISTRVTASSSRKEKDG